MVFQHEFLDAAWLPHAPILSGSRLGPAVAALQAWQATPAEQRRMRSRRITPAPYIAMDVASGRVIAQRDATRPWYPASVTKLMTVYVALEAVRQGRLTLDTPLVVSARAARMKPSKMGFAPGSRSRSTTRQDADGQVGQRPCGHDRRRRLGIGRGVRRRDESGGEFAGHARIPFREPEWVARSQPFSSARDMAVLGRALLLQFPNHADLFDIGAFRIGDMVVPTTMV